MFDFEKQERIIKNAFNEFKKCKNKNLKKMIRLQLLNNAYTYNVLSKAELNLLNKEV